VIGVCFAEDVASDIKEAARICSSLLGPTAVASDMTETGTRLEIVGYIVDLHTMRVSIAWNFFLSAIHGFL
jgi:hypothetical protein